jgi:hypothetical protein
MSSKKGEHKKHKAHEVVKSAYERLENFLTPQGRMMLCFLMVIAVVIGNIVWVGLLKLLSLFVGF